MTDRRKDFVPGGRVPAHLFRILCIETFGRVDDVEIHNQFADVVQITRDGDTFDCVIGPTHFARDDFSVLAYTY